MFPKNVKNADFIPSAVQADANAQRKTEATAKATKPFSTPACHFSGHLLRRRNRMWNAECEISFARIKDRRIKSLVVLPLFEERGPPFDFFCFTSKVISEPNNKNI